MVNIDKQIYLASNISEETLDIYYINKYIYILIHLPCDYYQLIMNTRTIKITNINNDDNDNNDI